MRVVAIILDSAGQDLQEWTAGRDMAIQYNKYKPRRKHSVCEGTEKGKTQLGVRWGGTQKGFWNVPFRWASKAE